MTSSSAFPRAFLYRCALGPLFSNGGLKNWTLHLASDRIVGVSLGLWLSVKAGILAGIGQQAARAYSGYSDAAAESALLTDEGDPGWRRYDVSTLELIAVRRSMGANEVRISSQGEKVHVYGIGDRSYTEECRSALRALYPALYREEGF